MTIDDARTHLWEWFEAHDIFQIDKDANALVWLVESDEQEEERNACLKGALTDFVTSGMIKQVRWAEKEYYILDKPFDTLEQTISVGHYTAKRVALTINNFCDAIGDRTDWADQGNLQEKDLRSLIAVVTILEERIKTQQ